MDSEGTASGAPESRAPRDRDSPPDVLRVLDGLGQGDPLGLGKQQRHSPGNEAHHRFQQNRSPWSH